MRNVVVRHTAVHRRDTSLLAQLLLRGVGVRCRVELRTSVFDRLNKLKIIVAARDFERACKVLEPLLVEVRHD